MHALLRLEEVYVGYQRPVLGPLSLSIAAGEVLGLCGSNGCGKSTLLKALSGEARLFGGQVHKSVGLQIALQKQHLPRLQGFPLAVDEYLRLLSADPGQLPDRLAALRRIRLDQLSGGQYQLLSVWACLASPAHLLLLDEPTNNLDPAGVALLQELLAARRQSQAVILISHDHAFVSAASTRQLDLTHLHNSDL